MTPITTIADLQALPQWVNFDQVPQPDGEKPRKEPYTPGTSSKARVNDPRTWRTYAEARADAERTGRLPGVAITPAMGLTLIDIDGRADHPLIAALSSYTERSLNGGLHIVVRGRPPVDFTTPAGVEVYPRHGNRFVIITGTLVDGRDTIEDRTELLATLFPAKVEPPRAVVAPAEWDTDDTAVIERTLRMAKGRRLHQDGARGDYASDSEADLGLLNCYVLAGATNETQLDRLFRASAWGKERAKWDDRPDYRTRTLARALDGTVQPFKGWDQPALTSAQSRATIMTPGRTEQPTAPTGQDDPSDADPCTAERDTIAALRAEVATLRAENAALSRLQSATMALLRSRNLQAGEKIIGLVSLFEAEAATTRGTTDPEGWTDTPLERIAESAGCSAKVAGKHQATISTTGIIESRTIDRRDPDTGVITKRRQIRIPAPTSDTPTPSLPERILALSTATPERDPSKQRWGGKRPCPGCGNVGTVTTTTVACKGCGAVLSAIVTEQPPELDTPTDPPIGQLDLSKKRGSLPIGQLDPSGDIPYTKERREQRTDREQRRDLAKRDLQRLAETPSPPKETPPDDQADISPQPMLFAIPDSPPLDPRTDVAYGARR